MRPSEESQHPRSDDNGALRQRVAELEAHLAQRERELAALEEREALFRASIENMLDSCGIYAALRDADGQIIDFRVEYVNAAACHNNRMTREEQVGRTLLDILPAHGDSGLFAEYCHVVETGEPLVKWNVPYADTYNDEWLERYFDIQVVKSGDGFLAAWRDVTERTHTHHALQEALALLDALFESAPVGLALFDSELRYRRINRQLAAINGLPPEDHIGKRPSELLPDLEGVDALEKMVRTVVTDGTTVPDLEVVGSTPASPGRRVWRERFYPLQGPDAVVGIGAIVEDVTDFKQTEAALQREQELMQKLFDRLPIMLTMYDPETQVLRLNKAFERTIGWTTAEAAQIDLMEQVYPDPAERADAAAYMQSGVEGWREFRVISKTGEVVPSLWSNIRLFDDTRVGVGIDLREQRRAQQERAQMLERISDAFFALDWEWRFTYVNSAAEAGFRTSKAELLGQNIWQALPETVGTPFEHHYRQAMETQQPVEFEAFYSPFQVWIHVRVYPSPEGLSIFFQDVSERRRLRQERSEALALLDSLFESVPMGLAFLDTDLRFTHVNRALADINGLPPESHTGKRPAELLPDLEGIEALEDLGRNILQDGNPVLNREVQGHTPASTENKVWKAHYFPVHQQKKIVGLGTITEDVTALKQAEQALRESEHRFRTALQNMPTVIAHVDTERRYLWIHNPDPDFRPEDVIGKRDEEVWPHKAFRQFGQMKQEVLSSGVGMRREHTFPLPDGPRTYDIVLEPLRNADGVVVGLTTAALDITERKRAETEREQLLASLDQERTQLAQLNETLEQRVQAGTEQVRLLAAQLSVAEQEERARIAQVLHDYVQQLLYAIQMRMQLMELDLSATSAANVQEGLAETKQLLEDATQATRSLAHELNPPVLGSEDVGELLQWLASHMQNLHELHTRVTVTGRPHLADKTGRILLFHVVRELLFNVVKHANVTEAEITAAEITAAEGEGRVQISVRDGGAGFDPASSAGEGARKPGLGLPGIRERLQLFQGEMQIRSAPGQGTTITLVLPT